ncbi:hypothetical protein, partial [Streptomyces rhizosphaericus]|uniref:hypothetical protein n=1 Tax=Streptomyces rhizosphaericus TaxID=114699 RepID=UPI001FC9B3CA
MQGPSRKERRINSSSRAVSPARGTAETISHSGAPADEVRRCASSPSSTVEPSRRSRVTRPFSRAGHP